MRDDAPENEVTTTALGEAFAQVIREAVQEEISKARSIDDRDDLLTVEQLMEQLKVSKDWVYDNASKLPFTRKLGPKMLRFSRQGLLKWLSTRKVSQ